MNWWDWLIVLVPMMLLCLMALTSRKYVKNAADFLVAGRVAGRYVLSVGDMTSGLSIILLISSCEVNYQTGFAIGFWWTVIASVGTLMALTGFCTYRWRETRCLSMGEFLELRYGSRFFRIFCAMLRCVSELGANAIGPAIAANFFIYYLGLPHRITLLGVNLPCYGIIVVLCVALAVFFIWPSGRISLLITDCVQGILSYPIFVVIVGYILLKFSWWNEISPVLGNHVHGESFLNPYDVDKLRDFNVFALIVSFVASIINRAQWIGNDTSGVAKTPHEQKMAGILGAWRNGFSTVMVLLLTVIVIVFLNHPGFLEKNRFGVTSTQIREELADKVLAETVPSLEQRQAIMDKIRTLPAEKRNFGIPLSQSKNLDTPYYQTVYDTIGHTPEGRLQYQKFRSLFQQMLMPSLLSRIFPTGMIGLFCLLAVMLLVSTDDSRIFNSSSTLMQDVILPFFRHRLTPEKHITWLRLTALGVGAIFLIVSLLFAQLDYISMFTTIICALWGGGAGPVMVFGLYSRFGNLYGAWSAIIFGSGISISGLIFQRNWAQSIYPFLEKQEWVGPLDIFLRHVSAPLEPWISWSMNPVKFPLNSFEIYFLAMASSITAYIAVSYLTYHPYNLEKLLHRGIYSTEVKPPKARWNISSVCSSLIGITPECSPADRVIAYSSFLYSIVYGLGICFFGVIIYNFFAPWPDQWWAFYFWLTMLIIPGIIGTISSVWFLFGGVRDCFHLFRDLASRNDEQEDNGQLLESLSSSNCENSDVVDKAEQ